MPLTTWYQAYNYKLQDVDADFLIGMNKGVQGFRLKINKIEGKAELIQTIYLTVKNLSSITWNRFHMTMNKRLPL